MNANSIDKANTIIDELNGESNVTIKRLKRDNGLIERKENENRIILAEDNRQVIFG